MNQLGRRLRQFFSYRENAIQHPIFADSRKSFEIAQILSRVFYGLLLFNALVYLPNWPGATTRPGFDPIWIVSWIQLMDHKTGVLMVLSLYLLGPLAAVALPGHRWARIAAFLGIILFVAYNNSFGKIGHSLHLYVYLSFLLIFLPNGWTAPRPNRTIRQHTILVHWGCMATVMLTYSLAGLIKVWVGIGQLALGQPSLFGTEALARHIADRLSQTGDQSYLGAFFIENNWAFWPLMPLTIYIEVFAFWAVFRPRIGWWLALSLIGFHLASYFTMTIIFPQSCLLLALYFFIQPYGEKDRWDILRTISDLPGVPLARKLLGMKHPEPRTL